MHRKLKPNPAIFVQNAEVHLPLTPKNDSLWIENSFVGASWRLGARQIITGVPKNDWRLTIPDGICIDIVPLADQRWAVRPYGFDDTFKGDIRDEKTLFLGMSFSEWLVERELSVEDITGRKEDLQAAAIFPVVEQELWKMQSRCWKRPQTLPTDSPLPY